MINQLTKSTEETKLIDRLGTSWYQELESEFKKDYMINLRNFLSKEIKSHTIYPPHQETFSAFKLCPLDKIKVVILGQDPYHGPNQAHGLCFSVQDGVKPPPSLVNIFKELNRDLGIELPQSGNLSAWASQGVFLLNTCLSVRASSPGSHFNQGWEIFTDKAIEIINHKSENIVFMLWGSPARKKSSMIDSSRHLILEAPHPSPLSAHRGFLGCGHFSKANEYLNQQRKTIIDWRL
jgi:uracil-DNA glycosylase